LWRLVDQFSRILQGSGSHFYFFSRGMIRDKDRMD